MHLVRLILCLTAIPMSAQALERDALNAAQTVAGIYSSIYIHEFGHALAYNALGGKEVTIEVPRRGTFFGGNTSAVFERRLLDNERRIIAASGLVASNFAVGVSLGDHRIYSSPFGQAIIGEAILSNVVHLASYYTKIGIFSGYRPNDINEFENAGGNPHLYSIALAAFTTYSIAKMQRKHVPFFYINIAF